MNKIKAEKQKEEETEHESSNDDDDEKDELGDLAAEDVSMNAIKATVIYMNNVNKINTSGAKELPMMDVFYSTKITSKKRFSVRALADTGASTNVISSKVARKWRLKVLKPSQRYRVQDAKNNPIRVDGR